MSTLYEQAVQAERDARASIDAALSHGGAAQAERAALLSAMKDAALDADELQRLQTRAAALSKVLENCHEEKERQERALQEAQERRRELEDRRDGLRLKIEQLKAEVYHAEGRVRVTQDEVRMAENALEQARASLRQRETWLEQIG